MDVAIELLRRIPARRLAPGGTFRDCVPGFETSWSESARADPWHVPVTVVTRYAAMDDVKALILSREPGADLTCWSLRYFGDGGADASWEGGRLRLSPEDMELLKKDHADGRLATDPYGSWSFSCDRDEWPEAFGSGPVRLTAKTASIIRAREAARLAGLGEDGLREALDCLDMRALSGGMLLQAAMTALALAGKTGTAAFLYRC